MHNLGPSAVCETALPEGGDRAIYIMNTTLGGSVDKYECKA
jgi:hypothetical protein